MGEQNPPRRNQQFNPLLGFMFDGMQADPQPPRHWLRESVQLHNGKRTTRVTVPSTFVDHVGINKDDLPEVDCYFDPSRGLAIFDLENHFNGGEN